MSSKFSIELAQGTVTVEGDEEFIKSVYQALQDTLLSGDAPTNTAQQEPEETPVEAENPEPEPAKANVEIEAEPELAEAEAPNGHDENVTPINVVEAETPEPAAPLEEDGAASLESIKPKYEPIPAVLDPDRAEREKAEAEAEANEEWEETPVVEEARLEPTPASRGSVLEQIKESLDDDEDSGSQTSILQRIRDSLSEDSGKAETEDTPRAADAG